VLRTVTILRNSGGALQQVGVLSFPWIHLPTAIVAGRFTNSGHLDLIVGSSFGRSITVVPGNGDGSFQTGHRFLLNSWSPVAMATLNRPGTDRALVAIATTEGSLRIYGVSLDLRDCDGECDGDGGRQGVNKLTLVGAHDLGGIPTAMATENFFGHPYPDLAVTVPGRVSLFFGHSNGDVTPAVTIPVGSFPSAIAAGDLGGGGLADLAVTDSATNTVTALLNRNGTFTPALGGAADTGAQPSGVAVGDFSGGGAGGVAITNGGDNTVSVLFRNRSRVFTVVGAGPQGTTSNEADLVWADLLPANTLLFEGGLG